MMRDSEWLASTERGNSIRIREIGSDWPAKFWAVSGMHGLKLLRRRVRQATSSAFYHLTSSWDHAQFIKQDYTPWSQTSFLEVGVAHDWQPRTSSTEGKSLAFSFPLSDRGVGMKKFAARDGRRVPLTTLFKVDVDDWTKATCRGRTVFKTPHANGSTIYLQMSN